MSSGERRTKTHRRSVFRDAFSRSPLPDVNPAKICVRTSRLAERNAGKVFNRQDAAFANLTQ